MLPVRSMADSRPTLPYDPRASLVPQGVSVTGRIGRGALRSHARALGLLGTLGAAVASTRTPGLAARNTVRRILTLQVLYTGFEALPLISAIALLIGASIIFQTNLMVPGADGALLGKILVAVVLRELAPLITAIVVAGRSGTAIATELGNMKVNAEIYALMSLGIDPPRFVVWPRLLATALSVIVLMVYFAVVALSGAFIVGLLMGEASLDGLRLGVASTVMTHDLMLFLAKGVGLGTIVGWLCCHFGLEVKSSPTEVPIMASRAVVTSLLGCVVYNTLVTAVFYSLVGPPIR
jgi:phospholipid/cholesterol/gamma-HCH transport system permease protein